MSREIFSFEIERFLGIIEGRKQALGEFARTRIDTTEIDASCLVTRFILYKGFRVNGDSLARDIDTEEFSKFYFFTALFYKYLLILVIKCVLNYRVVIPKLLNFLSFCNNSLNFATAIW